MGRYSPTFLTCMNERPVFLCVRMGPGVFLKAGGRQMARLNGLVIKVKEGERFLLNLDGTSCWVGVAGVGTSAARLVVDAPKNVVVVREKIIQELERCRQL